MAFPSYSIETPQQFTSATTSHVVDLPATVNSDNLLLIFFNCYLQSGNAMSATIPTGWTLEFSNNISSGDSFFSGFSLQADGTEGGTTVDLVTNEAAPGEAIVVQIWGWNAYEDGTIATASVNDSPNPPSITPSWGVDDILSIASFGAHNDDATVSAIPTNYSDGTSVVSGAGIDAGSTLGIAFRQVNTGTEDPGTFTLSEGENWAAQTSAIQGGALGSDPAGGGTSFTGDISIGHTLGLSPSGGASTGGGVTNPMALDMSPDGSASVSGGVTNAQTMGMSDEGGATTLASLEQAITLALSTSSVISFEGNITIDVTYGQSASGQASTSAELAGAENVTLFHAYAMSTSAQSSAAGATSIDLSYDQSVTGAVDVTNFTASVALGALTYQTSIEGTASTVASATQDIQYVLDSIAAAAVSSSTTINYINDISVSGTVITVDVTLSDGRTLSIKLQNRTLSIDSENRTLTIDP